MTKPITPPITAQSLGALSTFERDVPRRDISSNKSFYEAVDQRGGLINLENTRADIAQLADLSQIVCYRIRDSINRTEFMLPLGNIPIEIINNENFNAFAYCHQGHEGIAINIGVIKRFYELSADLWSEKGLLGDERVGWRANEFLPKLLPSSEIKHWQNINKGELTSEQRILYQTNTILTAILFVFMHEAGHLVKAHIPFLGALSKTGFTTLSEFDSRMELICSRKQLQYLEVDADILGSRGITDLAINSFKNGTSAPLGLPLSDDTQFSFLVNLYRGLLLALFCLDEKSSTQKLESTTSHPMPGVRFGVVSLSSVDLLHARYSVDDKVAGGALVTAAMEIGDLFTKGNIRTLTFQNNLMSLFEKGGGKVAGIEKFLQGVKPFMDARLRKLGRNPTYFDQLNELYKRR